MDDHIYTFFQLDQNEYRLNDAGEDLYAWDAQGWVGTDYDKLFLKSEGDYVLEGEWWKAEVQVLYVRLIPEFSSVPAGHGNDSGQAQVRHDGVIGGQAARA